MCYPINPLTPEELTKLEQTGYADRFPWQRFLEGKAIPAWKHDSDKLVHAGHVQGIPVKVENGAVVFSTSEISRKSRIPISKELKDRIVDVLMDGPIRANVLAEKIGEEISQSDWRKSPKYHLLSYLVKQEKLGNLKFFDGYFSLIPLYRSFE